MSKNNKKYDLVFTTNDKEQMRKDYMNGLSIRDIQKKYNIHSNQWLHKKVLFDITRSYSEANVLSHKHHPDSFKHTEDSKEKIRKARLKYMEKHPESTAWRLAKKNTSYPEKCFIKYLIERGIDKKYNIEREKSVFPYFIDFAFNDIKIAIEIDGSQHQEEDRKMRDNKKDKLLTSLGWQIIRVTEDVVKHDWGTLDSLFNNINKNEIVQPGLQIGIFKEKKVYQKKERLENGLTEAQNQSSIKQRHVIRPSKEVLFTLIKQYSFVELGRRYGVCDKSIVKWCKYYGLPFKRSEIKKL